MGKTVWRGTRQDDDRFRSDPWIRSDKNFLFALTANFVVALLFDSVEEHKVVLSVIR